MKTKDELVCFIDYFNPLKITEKAAGKGDKKNPTLI